MIDRCYNPNIREYHWYGARGITVCREWRESFKAFYDDMGDRPSQKYGIDRINNDGNYEPGNCKWASHKENTRHTRWTKLNYKKVDEIKRSDLSITQLANIYGVTPNCIRDVKSGKTWN